MTPTEFSFVANGLSNRQNARKKKKSVILTKGFRVFIRKTEGLTPVAVLERLEYWDLVDILDLKVVGDGFDVLFRTPESAHVVQKLDEFESSLIDAVPEDARVPAVYIQGIPQHTSRDEIRRFFKTIAPVLNVKYIEKGRIGVHVLKFASTRKALRVSETADREKFGGNTLTVSHQFKSTVTKCFFLSGVIPNLLSVEAVEPEVSQIGPIDRIFKNEMGSLGEVFVSMQEQPDAKLACAIMNKRLFEGETINAYFVDPSYFDELYWANKARHS